RVGMALADRRPRHRAADEWATSILGAALSLAAASPRVKASRPWQTAFQEWNRRNFILDHSRPSWRRWGVLWVSEDEQRTREARHADVRQAIVDHADRIDRLANNINSLIVQHQNAS